MREKMMDIILGITLLFIEWTFLFLLTSDQEAKPLN